MTRLMDSRSISIRTAATSRCGSVTLYAAAACLGLVVALQSAAPGTVLHVSVAIAAAFAGFASRRRWADALLFAGAHAAAAWCIDEVIGPAALAVVVLSTLAFKGRPRFALALGISIVSLVAGGARIFERFASTSLTTQDLHYFAAQFAANREILASQPNASAALAVVVGGLIVVTALGWILDGGRAIPDHALPRMFGCLTLALCCAIPVIQQAAKAAQEPAPDLHAPRVHTPLLTFLSTLFAEPIARWQRVPTEEFESQVRRMTASPHPVATPTRAPADIVLFLQESQFNPALVDGCPPQLCELPAFGATAGTTDFGPLRVPVHGSGTWLSEFASLTGLPHWLWGRAGRYATFNIAPKFRRTFVTSLKDAGYHTIAIYPTHGGLMNGREALRAYGFDEFLDSEDLHLPHGFSAPDSLIHAAAIEALERGRALGKPVFVFALTIFNHSEHGILLDRVPDDFKRSLRSAISDPEEAQSLADYVWRSNEFSRALEASGQRLLGTARPTVLAWFGDHQPPFALAPGLQRRIAPAGLGPRAYTTWYAIRTNNRTLKDPPIRSKPMDLVFLPGLLAERAGVALDPWLAANVLARQECEGAFMECPQPQRRNEYLTYMLDTLQVHSDRGR